MEYGKDFNIGDRVKFGVRCLDMRTGRNRVDGRNGGILRLTGTVVDYAEYSRKQIVAVKHHGNQFERFPARLYNLRKLKNGWVVETEHDDPKGRLYLEVYSKELEAAE